MAEKVGLRISDESYQELQNEADAKGVQIAQHIRMIFDNHFQQQGKVITSKVQWGGHRKKKGE